MFTNGRTFAWLSVLLLIGSLHARSADTAWPVPEGREKLPDTCRRPETKAGQAVVPYVIKRFSLENVTFHVKGGAQPDTFLRFSPDGKRLAVGTFLGRIMMMDVYSGRVLWDRKVAEGMVKQIDFSPDGRRVYLGEQSVDGFVYGADAETGKTTWKFRLADDLKTSAPPAKDEVFGIYSLPGCYRLFTLKGGDVLVLGIHSWGDWRKPETQQRLSRVYRLSPEGKVRWAFPKKGPAPCSLIYMAGDPGGRRAVVLVQGHKRKADASDPCVPGSVLVLDGATGVPVGHHAFAPLQPHFKEILFWQSVSVGPRGRRASVGMFDGRSFLVDLDTVKPSSTFSFGAPIMLSGMPVSAMATYTHLAPDGTAYFQTSSSSVPNVNAMRHVVSPPGPHPNANTINAVGTDGKVKWRYRSGHIYQNFWTSADGRWLMTCVKRHREKKGKDAGAILFDTHRPGGGSSKFVYYYRVEGLTFFHADMAPDGSAMAICETPYKDPKTGKLIGKYRVHIVR